jgi:hypothetical protein
MVMAIWTTWTSDRAAIPSPDSSYRKRAHSGPKMRFGSAATTCAKASRQPLPLPGLPLPLATGHWPLATGHFCRWCWCWCVVRVRGATRNFRTEVGSPTRRHPVVVRRWAAGGRSVGGFWPRAYVVKKGHAHAPCAGHMLLYISCCRRAIFGTSAPPPSSLCTCCYLLASAFHRLYWVLSHEASI